MKKFDFFFLLQNGANFFKMGRFSAIFHAQYLFIFEVRVKVGKGRVGYCLSHSKCNRFRVGVGD